jgi:DeoR family transcriptional regulator, fructose operon transcriptional repressor
MSFQQRKNVILDLLDQKGELTVKELAELLNTSEITVRRDLVTLTADGLLFRTHGGVMKVDLIKRPFDFAHKVARNVKQKDHICRLAAQEINDGEVIFMDCGSTVFRLCSFIRHKRIRVVTNSLPVIWELRGSTVEVNVAGGEVDQERLAVHGRIAEEHIARYRADKAFLGVDAISAENGLSAGSELEAGMTLSMASNAQKTYLLCDSSKVGTTSYLKFAPIDIIDVLICEKKTTAVSAIEDLGVRLLI